ncbi:hypothetical protein AVEN_221911-1 [Araneus ventricosus]|uniref:Uncharacterized protein n=1 Tax=Araneus ventricosus TaxID=182803 RepID=A0A4Y2F644_ARAVE|nr:hypothetical protein AVEN_221911-1 [Araneus ventricosus]
MDLTGIGYVLDTSTCFVYVDRQEIEDSCVTSRNTRYIYFLVYEVSKEKCREDFVSVTIKNLQMRTIYAGGIECLKKQDVCAKGKLAEGHVFQRKTLKEFAAKEVEVEMPTMSSALGHRDLRT